MAPVKKSKTLETFLVLLIATLFIFLFFYFFHPELWWDEIVYAGMARYFSSGGSAGLFESIRPLGFPLFLSLFSGLSQDYVALGRVIAFLFSIGALVMFYLASKRIFDKRTAVLAALFLSINWIFLFFSRKILTGIPAMFFVFLGMYFFARFEDNFDLRNVIFLVITGVSFGLAFLTRFPSGIFMGGLLIVIFISFLHDLFKSKNKVVFHIEKGSIILGSFLVISTPFFIFNIIKYADPFEPFKAASLAIKVAVACNYFLANKWYFYFIDIFKSNPLTLLAIPAVFFVIKKFNLKRFLVLLFAVLPWIYFQTVNCKESRYSLLFLPFVLMLSAYAFFEMIDLVKRRKWKPNFRIRRRLRKILSYFPFFGIIILISLNVIIISSSFELFSDIGENPFLNNIKNLDFSGRIMTTTPFLVLYHDVPIEALYSAEPRLLKYKFEELLPFADQIYYNPCDVPCPPGDGACEEEVDRFTSSLVEMHQLINRTEIRNCTIYLFKK